MGRIFLILIAALVAVMVLSAVIATLHLLFVIALIAVLAIGALRLSRGVRRRSDRYQRPPQRDSQSSPASCQRARMMPVASAAGSTAQTVVPRWSLRTPQLEHRCSTMPARGRQSRRGRDGTRAAASHSHRRPPRVLS